jgi:hypothetical protein
MKAIMTGQTLRPSAALETRLLAGLLSLILICLPLLSHGMPVPVSSETALSDTAPPCHADASGGQKSDAGVCCDGVCWDCAQCVPAALTHEGEPATRGVVPGVHWLVALTDRLAAGFPETPLRPPAALSS